MKLHVVAMSRQADIGAVPVHAGGGEDMGAIDRHALRFVDRRRIAMIDMRIILRVERDPAPVIKADAHAFGRYLLDRPQRAVLHTEPALVAKEHDAVAGRKLALAALGLHHHVLA